jgi:RNA polymerase sigma-70 factor (ECF subfamily)
MTGTPGAHDSRAGDPVTEVFAAERPRLVGLAYRLLGSVADADDVVQEAWFRWARADHAAIERPAAWLTTVVSRLGLDRLRSRRRERVDYVGPWLPEPIVRPMATDDPEQASVLADSLTTTFLVMLEHLSPEERLALLLVDVFGEPFRSVSSLLDRSEDACRQLAVRARRKLAAHREQAEHRPHSQSEQLALAAAFVGAVMSGDIAAVTSMLAPAAVATSDGGARRHAARRPIVGRDRIARFLVNVTKRWPPEVELVPVWVNGSPGVITKIRGRAYMVSVLEIVDGLVERQYSILNPDKLASIDRTVDLV